jgi:hypothetical protein
VVLGGVRFLMSEVPLYEVPLYRGTSLIRNSPLVGLNSRTMSRTLWRP